MTRSPAARAASAFRGLIAGISLPVIGEMPRNAVATDMVFAVNCPPQAPAPGQAAASSSSRSASLIRPAACAPTASKTSWMVTDWPR